ncbi:MAG: alpha-glucan family phosphorylase [Maribacter sp.]|nr:alpha-glucan family phosphorylase [Maribacter sp.]
MKKEAFTSSQLYGILPTDIDGIEALAELALDLRWSWNHAVDEIWYQLDPDLWMETHNPWVVLQNVSHDQLKKQMADQTFRGTLDEMMKAKEKSLTDPAWFQMNHTDAPLECVAYFSMEFMLNEALPIYVGGLGNVAGDQLKSASDLGVPVIALGLLYQQGYFRQLIDPYGTQQELFPYNDPGQLPITPLRLPNGEWLRVKVIMSGHTVWLRTWQVQVGRVKLYLMDSNDPTNMPFHRSITSEVYGGGLELRIQQEIILGIGGWKLLKAMNISPEVCHMNEGHAAFLVLERAGDFMKENNVTFEEALAVTRAGNVFTTHTAVAAGFDHFSPALMWQYFGNYAKDELNLDFNDLLALGRENPFNWSAYFNMAYLAIHGSGAINGVSRLHKDVSRRLFRNLFPRWPIHEVPVGSVTNGVHMPSWDSVFADKIWTHSCGKERWRGELETVETDIFSASDIDLWQFRKDARNHMINYIRERFARQSKDSGQSLEIIERAKQVFNPATLTLGFARRFVPYKRPNLLLHDTERLIRILTNPKHPVQLVLAGKSPPYDESGKALIRQWVQFIQQHNLYDHVVFLSDYDMLLTEHLVQGVDVWLNTPRRPWEACGTSGMKVLVNGGINLSELDGWWAEAYTPEVGWALGDGQEHGDDPTWDALEATSLYDLLEEEVVPEFYTRSENGIPEPWVAKMRKSMSILTPRFSANRAVREYTEKYYLPAAANYKKRASNGGCAGKQIVNTLHDLQTKWEHLQFGETLIENIEGGYHFTIRIALNHISPNDISVELFAEGINGSLSEIITMRLDPLADSQMEHTYRAQIHTTREASDYTARIIPSHEDISVPLENNLILWQR